MEIVKSTKKLLLRKVEWELFRVGIGVGVGICASEGTLSRGPAVSQPGRKLPLVVSPVELILRESPLLHSNPSQYMWVTLIVVL